MPYGYYYYYYYKICIAHKFKHARVGGAGTDLMPLVRLQYILNIFLKHIVQCKVSFAWAVYFGPVLKMWYLYSCQVKLTGELILSFPVGIIRHIVDNPSANTLSFRMKNTASVEQYIANKPLIVEYVSFCTFFLDPRNINNMFEILIDMVLWKYWSGDRKVSK